MTVTLKRPGDNTVKIYLYKIDAAKSKEQKINLE